MTRRPAEGRRAAPRGRGSPLPAVRGPGPPSRPVRSLTSATPSSPRSATTSVAPNSRASAARSSCLDMAMTRSAPSWLAARTAMSPTAPSPTTATVSPGPASAATAPNHPVPRTSEAASREATVASSAGRRTSHGPADTTLGDSPGMPWKADRLFCGTGWLQDSPRGVAEGRGVSAAPDRRIHRNAAGRRRPRRLVSPVSHRRGGIPYADARHAVSGVRAHRPLRHAPEPSVAHRRLRACAAGS